MRQNRVLAPCLVVLLLGAVSGCPATGVDGNGNSNGGGNDNGAGPANGEVIIPQTTKLLDSEDIDALASASPDLSQLVFSRDTRTLEQLATGDVVVCGVHGDLLPYGMLRKVITVDRDAGQVVVQTVQASLTEAIERGALDETVLLDPNTIVKRTTMGRAGGRSFFRSASGLEGSQGFVFAINDYELYDADGDASTKGDRVWVDGNFSFAPEMGFALDIDGFELQTLTFEIGAEQQASIRVTAGREATFAESEILEEIELTPITFSIGPIPVVLVPRIQFRIGVDGTVTADLTAGVQADATVRVGFGYQNGGWGPTSDFDSGASFDAPNFRDGSKGSARVWAGPRAELAAYGIAGVYGELRGFVRADVDAAADPWWKLSAGVEALAGVFIRIFDQSIAEYETDPLGESIDLADAGGPAPSDRPEVITWARSFGGADRDNAENPVAVLATPDGGCLVAGGTNSFTSSPGDAWIIKLDRLGQVSWQRAIEDQNNALGAALHPEGGYVILTGTVGTGASLAHVIRLDDNGDAVWGYRYAADKALTGYGLLASGSTFVVGGIYGSGTDSDFWFATLDGSGQVAWSKAIGGDSSEQVDGLALSQDGGVVGVGPTHSFGVSFNGSWAVKLGADGQTAWQYSFDGEGNEWVHAVVADPDGNYKFVGRTGADALVIKLGAGGQLQSSAIYDAGSPYEEAFSALGTPDGGLLIAGNTGLSNESDLWLMRLTPQLEVLWTTSYGGPLREEAGGTIQYGAVSTPLAQAGDEGFFVLANTTSFGAAFYDAWVQKISGTGTITYDDGSTAASTSLAGSFEDYDIESAPTSAASVDVALQVTPIEMNLYTPAPRIVVQATP